MDATIKDQAVTWMDLLSNFDPDDPISKLLRGVRVRSTVYCRSLMGAPWGFGVDAHGNPAFHVVTSGRCWLEADGQPDQVRLDAGDFVVLPAGPRHCMRDAPNTPVTSLDEILATTPLDAQRRLSYGGGGPRTGLLCGGFSLDGGTTHPVLSAVPTALVIRGSRGRPAPWLAATLSALSAEAEADAPGAEEVVTRLADALLAQALRLALIDLQALDTTRIRTMRDSQIAAAVALIHDQPERPWTVGELASAVALSRSELASRFRHLVGEPPLSYVTRTRLAHAAALLRTGDSSLAQIAARTGYASQFSFSKAFKRSFGIAPAAYRGQAATMPDLEVFGALSEDPHGTISGP